MRRSAAIATATPVRGSAAVAALLLATAPALARPAGPDDAGHGSRRDDAVTFTVSGGISLGVYAAGLTWGLVRLLQAMRESERLVLFHPRLATVTGASAGAVNAFVAAALWCERPQHRGGVDSNLLLDAWLDLDASELLPSSGEHYAAGDGLLAAAPLERAGRVAGERIFGSSAQGRFAPGCRVPVGITVTPFEPRRHDVAGLSASTQRLVVPWRFEVGSAGEVTIRRQPIVRRDLADDVLELAGIPSAGETAAFRKDVVIDALLASTAFPVAFAPRVLCARDDADGSVRDRCEPYVDGGIFDNAPLGLGVALVEDTGGGTVLHPISSFLVDPSRRRLRPSGAAAGASGGPGTLAGQLQLLANLVGTARTAELARAARARGWNRTTERLVREASAVAADMAEMLAGFSNTSPAGDESRRAGGPRRSARRAAFGRSLSECLDRLAGTTADPAKETCAHEILGTEVVEASGTDALPEHEVVRLAERLARFLRESAARDTRGPADAAVRLRLPSIEVTWSIAAATMLFLADEVRRVSASTLPDQELRRFRDAVLEPVRVSSAANRVLSALLRDRLGDELARLGRVAPSSVADEARRAREQLAPSAGEAFFDLEVLEGPSAATRDAVARATWSAAAAAEAWRGVQRIVDARSRAVEVSARVDALRRSAASLADPSGIEHQLVISSRFAPLVGSQLGGFAAFLDRPLRRYDYYAGIYEAVHVLAAGICTNEPPRYADASPVRLARDPAEIDLTAPATQRCIGHVMRTGVEALGVRTSPGARHVVAKLASLELAASLGSSERAAELRKEPSWAWLNDLLAAPEDPGVEAVLEVLTGAKVACRPEDREPLCPAELSFDEFLAALDAHGYRATSAGMSLALRDPAVWWAETLERLADRAFALEHASPSAPGPLSAASSAALAGTSLVARRAASRGPAPRFLLDPSTIPGPAAPGQAGWGWRRVAAHVIPYRLALDFAHGGFGAAWIEPELHLARWFSIQTTLEEIGYRTGTGWTSAAGALAVGHAGGVSLGAGPRAWIDWSGGSGVGIEGRLSVLQDRLGLGFGVRDPGGGPRGHEWFLNVSVADLNGLVFWMLSPVGGR